MDGSFALLAMARAQRICITESSPLGRTAAQRACAKESKSLARLGAQLREWGYWTYFSGDYAAYAGEAAQQADRMEKAAQTSPAAKEQSGQPLQGAVDTAARAVGFLCEQGVSAAAERAYEAAWGKIREIQRKL